MILLAISLITFTLPIASAFDNEDFFTLLCAADENNMEYIYEKCELVLRDAVDGCMEKCFIEIRNRRSPPTRIDDKYYQFVMCDQGLWQEFLQCASPCIQELQINYNGFNNLMEWSDCMVEVVRNMEDEIEHQDDPNPKPGSKLRPTKRPTKKNGKNGNKGKVTDKKKGKLRLRMKKS